jgi:hypothetical protein
MHIVYRVSGPSTDLAYYGYAIGETIDDAKSTFMVGANRKATVSANRGDRRLLEANRNDPSTLTFEEICIFAIELDAWSSRNDERASNVDAITGPTMLPGNMANQAKELTPERFAEWAKVKKQRDAKTAREAWGLGMWTTEAIKDLSNTFNKKQVIVDLDKMDPQQFALKYAL